MVKPLEHFFYLPFFIIYLFVYFSGWQGAKIRARNDQGIEKLTERKGGGQKNKFLRLK